MKDLINVLVHDGPFHADDVFAVALLKYYYKDKTIKVTRSRTANYDNFDYVVDVGRKYDGVKFFDHHQGGLYWDNEIPKASLGLLFEDLYKTKLDAYVFKTILEILVYPIDARDCGYMTINQYQHLGLWVEAMVPGWTVKDPNVIEEKFNISVDMAKNIIAGVMERALLKKSASILVEDALHNSVYKGVLILNIPAPWKHVVTYGDVRFVAHPRDGSPEWNIQAINKPTKTYDLEEPLPKSIDKDVIFVHNSRHLATVANKEKLFEIIDKYISPDINNVQV